MQFNTDQIKGILDKGTAEAEQIMNDPARVDEILVMLEEKLKETAEPLAKNIPVQVLKSTPELEKKAVDGAVALYDRELNL